MDETFANHTPTAIMETILFLFQIAILAATMSAVLQENGPDTCQWMTYVRNTINSEAEAQAVPPKT
jgi:hypothetical protein